MIALYIGVHDGGSETMLERLSDAAGALESAGVRYPDVARGVCADDEAAWDEIKADAQSHPEAVVLAVVADGADADPKGLARRLKGLPVRIVGAQGDVADHAVLLYRRETLKGANRDDFDAFFARKLSEGAFEATALKAWTAAFASCEVHLNPPAGADGGLDDLLVALGLDAAARSAVEDSASEARPEPGWAILEIARSLAAEVSRRAELAGLDPAAAQADLAAAAREVEANMGAEGPGLYLTAEQIAILAEKRRKATKILAAHGGAAPAAPKVEPRAFLPEMAAIPADRLNPLLIEMTAALVHGGIIAPKLKRRAARIERFGEDQADPPAGPGKREGPMSRGLAKAKKRAKRRKQKAKRAA